MKRIIRALLLLAVSLFPLAGLWAQSSETEEFKPSGKPIVTIFSDFTVSSATIDSINIQDGSLIINDDKVSKKFNITRAYLGYKYNFSPNFSSTLILDVGDVKLETFDRIAYLKIASLDYANDKFSLNFGLLSTTAFNETDKLWGHRYVSKSFQDLYGYNSSADFGVITKYKFNKLISADAALFNGEGYKLADNIDSTLKLALGTTITPGESALVRLYYDFENDSADQQTFGILAGYTLKKYTFGADFNYQLNNKRTDGKDLYGFSLFAHGAITKKMGGFVRFDYLTSNTLPAEANPWNIKKNGNRYLAGVEFYPVKGIKLAPTFIGVDPKEEGKKFISNVSLYVEIKI